MKKVFVKNDEENASLMNNPFEKIWGFHVHQELPQADFAKALLIQEKCADYLLSQSIPVDAREAFKPGYGPHLNHMWELRVESNATDSVLQNLGMAISFLAVNRFGLSAYIHPLMHDPSLPEDLATEGRLNQSNILWFGERVNQAKDFFFQPPRDQNQKVIDTRTPRILTESEKSLLLEKGRQQLSGEDFHPPENYILNGFHLHLDYLPAQKERALELFDHFVKFLLDHQIRPTSTRLYEPLENGPHLQAGWEVKFERTGREAFRQMGVAVAWLMCNRQEFSVFLHPVTWKPGDTEEEYWAHSQYAMFIGDLPELDLNFFL
jgi:aromatic ring-cleaving dioxygenase